MSCRDSCVFPPPLLPALDPYLVDCDNEYENPISQKILTLTMTRAGPACLTVGDGAVCAVCVMLRVGPERVRRDHDMERRICHGVSGSEIFSGMSDRDREENEQFETTVLVINIRKQDKLNDIGRFPQYKYSKIISCYVILDSRLLCPINESCFYKIVLRMGVPVGLRTRVEYKIYATCGTALGYVTLIRGVPGGIGAKVSADEKEQSGLSAKREHFWMNLGSSRHGRQVYAEYMERNLWPTRGNNLSCSKSQIGYCPPPPLSLDSLSLQVVGIASSVRPPKIAGYAVLHPDQPP